jgi:Zn-dependent protease with chaperone function
MNGKLSMRISLFLISLFALASLSTWFAFSGFWLVCGLTILALMSLITVGYMDIAILVFLGAREVKGTEEAAFHSAAIQEAYKLGVSIPKLYFYNGALERAFVIQQRRDIGLIVSKGLLDICTKEELSAICFELLLQVKKNMASKRTKVLFLIGMITWIFQMMVNLVIKFIPIKDIKAALNGLVYFMIHPWLDLIYGLLMGKKYFNKLEFFLKEYPVENKLLMDVSSKLIRPDEIYSLPSKKLIELSSLQKSSHYQGIITLEFLPHEWDLIFNEKSEGRV